MTGCIFIVIGKKFDVDAYLKKVVRSKTTVSFCRGDKTRFKPRPVLPTSGFRVDVSKSTDDLKTQIRKATRFLEKHGTEIRRLWRIPGVQTLELRLGGYWYSDTIHFSFTLPSKLLALAGKYDVQIDMNFYATEHHC